MTISTDNVLRLDVESFEREVLQSSTPVLVDFWAPWCPPCRAIAPVIEQLADEFEGRVKVAKVDVDENEPLATRYSIGSIPTLVFFRDGQEVDRVQGVVPRAKLVEKLIELESADRE